MGGFFNKDWRKRLRKKKAPFQERCFFGSEGEIRTLDTRIMIPLL